MCVNMNILSKVALDSGIEPAISSRKSNAVTNTGFPFLDHPVFAASELLTAKWGSGCYTVIFWVIKTLGPVNPARDRGTRPQMSDWGTVMHHAPPISRRFRRINDREFVSIYLIT